MKVKIVQWNAVASWVWDLETDNQQCSICQVPFESTCPRCKIPGDDCPPVQGQCSHYFHLHCIVKWAGAEPNPLCPNCRTPWAEKCI